MTSGISDDVLEALWQDEGLQKLLTGLYGFQQGLVGYPHPAVADKITSLGLAEPIRGRLVLSPAGASLAYHFSEYRSQVVEGRIRPVLERLNIGADSIVLDFGCGGGQTLFACLAFRPRRVIGIDRDEFAVSFGRFLFRRKAVPQDQWAFFSSELAAVPLADKSVDCVICRLVLYRTPVNRTLGILSRLSAPGGRIYILAHSGGYYLSRLNIIRRNPFWLLFFLFVFLNGILFQSFGRQMTFRLGRKRLSELFFTGGSLKRALRHHGFKLDGFVRIPPAGRPLFWEIFGTRLPH